METKYFTKIEEKYVFNVSLIFWHLLVGLATIAVAGGTLLLLWGIIPPFKPSVKKQHYPPVATVSLEELQVKVLPEEQSVKAPKEVVAPAKVAEKTDEESATPAAGEVEYAALLDSLKTLIPPDKYAWKSRGHWEYPYGKEYWDYYKTARYRRWKVDRLGISDRLKYAYRRAAAEDFVSKRELLTAYLSVLNQFPEDKRVAVLKALTTYTKENVPQSVSNVQLLGQSIPNFSVDRTDFLAKLATFGDKNPNDGRSFIEYANRILNRFHPSVRFDALQTLISRYYKHFNNRISQQIEITDLFLPMMDKFEAEHQLKALENYYDLYLQRNADRMAEIQRIDREYERAMMSAASVHERNKAKKASWRKRGLYGIVGGLAFVAFLALILALLSMRKYLEKIYTSVEKASRAT